MRAGARPGRLIALHGGPPTTKRIGTRAAYHWFFAIPARWVDKDAFGRVTDMVHPSWFDSAVARFLRETGARQPPASELVGQVVETRCRSFAPFAFPETVTAGLRVARIGTSSVRYEIGVFRKQDGRAAAEGPFIHAYLTRATNRPIPIPEPMRAVVARFPTEGG